MVVAAATMVAAGFTGVDDVFSGERNFLDAYSARPEPSQLAEALGERFEIMATNIKKWSVGSPAQAALDALTHVMEGGRIWDCDVASIRVHLPTRSSPHRRQRADARHQCAASHGAASSPIAR